MTQKNIIKGVISNPLVQTFLIYVSGGWIALEMTDYFINKYGLNDKISDVLSIILLIGLPIALFLSWYLSIDKTEGTETSQLDHIQESSTIKKDQRTRVLYRNRRPQIIVSGFLILFAIAITLVFRMRHQSKIKWAREVAIPKIEEITDDMSWEGHHSWIAFDLVNEAKKYIPDDPLLIRLEKLISWKIKLDSNPSAASVYIKSYSDVNSTWKLLGKTPIDSIQIPSGLSKIRIEKEGFRTAYDLIWNHWSFVGNSLYYLLPKLGSIPQEMEMLSDTSIRLTSWPNLKIPGLERIIQRDIGDFLMDRYEVTNKDYKHFMDAGGYQNPEYWKYPFEKEGHVLSFDEAMALLIDKTGTPGPATWEIGDFLEGQSEYPVSGVSWYEASAYAEFVGKSLPTVYHWDQASLAYASSMIVPLSNFNNEGPKPVGSTLSMNRFGVYDLAGNVREWCFNESIHDHHRYIMGGGWNDFDYCFNEGYTQNPFDRSETNGFRCMKYFGSEQNKANLEAAIMLPFRDFSIESTVSNEIFSVYLEQYKYDMTDLNARVESVMEEEDFIREKISFDTPYGEDRMTAYLFLPKNFSPPYQTIIYFPNATALYSTSSEDLHIRNMFVKSGRAVIHPIYISTYERKDNLTSAFPQETALYKDHIIMWIKELSRSIDFLETRNDIDTDKLAYFGESWGGAMGGIIPAVEERIKTSVLVVAGLRFRRSYPEVDQVHYLQHIKTPVLMVNGRYDYFFPYETSQLPFYELLGTPKEHKKLVLCEQGHNISETQMKKETLSWLDQYLGPVLK